MVKGHHLINPDYRIALRQARIATHSGDAAATERWLAIAERYLRIRQRKQELDNPEIKPSRWR
jgi:hypothetical protein